VLLLEVKLISHTRLSDEFYNDLVEAGAYKLLENVTDGQIVAFTAIRTCYSHLKPSEIFIKEGEKYFKSKAKDGSAGSDGDRLIRHIMNSGHTSTVEHIFFTFGVEDLSRVALAQLTRHRVGYSYSVQSQRYVKFGSNDKSGGFGVVVPPSIAENSEAEGAYLDILEVIQNGYNKLRDLNISAEDARMLLPGGATCNLVLSCNLRGALEFYRKRGKHTHAQWEIQDLAEKLREKIVWIEPWADPFFEGVKSNG